MKIEQQFEVARPLAAVWDFFQDVPSVAQCLPGAEITEDRGDGSYAGKVGAKLGPMSVTFEGDATVEADPASHKAHIEGKGTDRKGGSRGKVSVDYALSATGTGTTVMIDADVSLSGAAAQFGRTGLINEMSKRLISEFVECLEAKLAAETKEEAATIRADEIHGVSLFFSTMAGWFKRLVGRLFRRS